MEEELIEVYRSNIVEVTVINEDPFNLNFESVRKLHGLKKSFIRKADRMIKGFVGANGAGSQQIEPEMLLGYTYLDCVIPTLNKDYLGQFYDKSPAHHAAVTAKVESVFGLGYGWIESDAYKRKLAAVTTEAGRKKAAKALEEAKTLVSDWLDKCNNQDCLEEVMRKMGVDYEATGDGFLEIGRDAEGKIGYLGHIPSKYMRIRRQRDGFVQIFSNQVTFFRNFGDKETPNPLTDEKSPNEIIHFKKYSPTGTYYGVPDLIAASHAIAGNEYAARYNIDYFENKAVPRQVIISKGKSLSSKSREMLIEFFETGLKGQHHRTIYIPLGSDDGEITFEKVENEDQEASFGDYRVANNEEIFMAHKVPMTRAGVFTKNVGLAATRDADKVFKESYSLPEQRIFENKINKVFKELTDIVTFKLNELSLIDEDTQSKIDERNVRMGIEVPNEVRSRKGEPARSDGKGDEPWQATAQQKADQKALASNSKQRDQQRQANNTDGQNAVGRNTKGEGRTTG